VQKLIGIAQLDKVLSISTDLKSALEVLQQ
jgi:hypothetical protein